MGGAKLSDAQEGDMIACDSCSLNLKCKYFRVGAVCGVPGSDNSDLGRYFNTRDSGLILEGLGKLLETQSERVQRGLQTEEALQELDPEVSKLVSNLFDQGVKLAKLVDPSLRTSPAKIQINAGAGSQTAVMQMSPQELVAGVMRELEKQGIRREDITDDMIKGLLASMGQDKTPHQAIEATAIASTTEVL
jgi:hypothetical protein